jgi:hypothetical protein
VTLCQVAKNPSSTGCIFFLRMASAEPKASIVKGYLLRHFRIPVSQGFIILQGKLRYYQFNSRQTTQEVSFLTLIQPCTSYSIFSLYYYESIGCEITHLIDSEPTKSATGLPRYNDFNTGLVSDIAILFIRSMITTRYA